MARGKGKVAARERERGRDAERDRRVEREANHTVGAVSHTDTEWGAGEWGYRGSMGGREGTPSSGEGSEEWCLSCVMRQKREEGNLKATKHERKPQKL